MRLPLLLSARKPEPVAVARHISQLVFLNFGPVEQVLAPSPLADYTKCPKISVIILGLKIMVKLSSRHNKASKSHTPKAISPVKTPSLLRRATDQALAQKLKTFDPVRHGGEVMASPLVGVERLTQD